MLCDKGKAHNPFSIWVFPVRTLYQLFKTGLTRMKQVLRKIKGINSNSYHSKNDKILLVGAF